MKKSRYYDPYWLKKATIAYLLCDKQHVLHILIHLTFTNTLQDSY